MAPLPLVVPIQTLMCSAIFCCAATCGAQTTQPAAAPATAPAQSPVRRLVRFVPHADGAPERVGAGIARAGSRKDDPDLRFTVLAPTKSWLSARPSPSLFWYTTKPTTLGLTITIVDSTDGKPVYQTHYTDRAAAGIQRLDLSKEAIQLKANVEYRWVIAVDTPEGRRDSTRESIGFIKVLPADSSIVAALNAAKDPQERLDLCGQQGLWYDLLAELEEQIAKYPADSHLRELRGEQLKDLLAGVGSAK